MNQTATSDTAAGRVGLYRSMVRIRMIEETIAARYVEQEMRCPVHLSIGQEAVAVGVCDTLEPSDQAVSTHRNHAHYLAKGGDLKAMIAEIYGKAAGCCGGRGGSMHLFDPKAGLVLSTPVVGSVIPIGVGVAFAMKRQGSSAVAVIFLGDASVEEGVFHESANFAVLKTLPALFVCENNLYSVYTNLAARQPPRPLADVAKAHAMPALHGDGNDVSQVRDLTLEAARRARRGDGPSLLVFDTYRWREHCGPNYDNDLGYRSEDEFLAWKARCPIARLRQRLVAERQLGSAEDEAMAAELRSEIDAAFAFAKSAPFPETTTGRDHVYA